MAISWYPGHMHKARGELAQTMRETDVVIELLDARAPAASANPLIEGMRGDLPCIRILNKADLADPAQTRRWQAFLNARPDTKCLISCPAEPVDRATLKRTCDSLVEKPKDPLRRRQALITGIPNVGKSTFMNGLAGRKVAKTGNEPALTRAQQRIKLDQDWYLVDSPGMLWPRLEDQSAAYRLACLGTIRNTAIDQQDVAWFAAEMLLKDFFPLLESRYGLQEKPSNAESLFETVAVSQGCLARRGVVDWQRVSTLLLDDLRSGRLGRLTLDAPPGQQ